MRSQLPVPAFVLWFGVTSLTIARCLGRRGVPVVAFHHDPHEPCTTSRYARLRFLPPLEADPQAWVDTLIAEARSCAPHKPALFVGTDAHWLFVAAHREKLEPHFNMAMPAGADVAPMLSKPYQYEAAARAGIPFPRTEVPRDVHDVERIAASMRYPCIIKPALSHEWVREYGQKLAYITTAAQLREKAREAMSKRIRFTVQEFIPATDDQIYGCNCYLDRDSNPLASCVVRKLRQFEPRFGSSCYSRSVHEPRVEQLAMRLLQSMRFHGISCVEFKRDPRDGEFKLMEANLRPPLMMAASVDSGIDLPWIAYRDMCGLPPEHVAGVRLGKRVGLIERDMHSARFYREMGQLTWLQWAKSWIGTRDLHFAWDDLRPGFRHLQSLVSHWRQGKFRHLHTGCPSRADWVLGEEAARTAPARTATGTLPPIHGATGSTSKDKVA